MSGAAGRTYRFAPRDRGGWVLGLSGAQCSLVAGGLAAVAVLLRLGAPPAAAFSALVVAVAVAFAPWESDVAHRQLAVAASWRRARRSAPTMPPLPMFDLAPRRSGIELALPAAFGDVELVALRTGEGSLLGAVRDRDRNTLTASVRVGGTGFALAERAEQDRLLAAWGEVLGGFCAEGGAVRHVLVTQAAVAGSLAEAEEFLVSSGAQSAAARQYAGLLAEAAPAARSHEVVVSVTVGTPRKRRGQRDPLPDEIARLCRRLEAAGLASVEPLGPGALVDLVRSRLDPSCAALLARRASSLRAAAERLTPRSIGPLRYDSAWDHLRVDASVHAAFWVSEWPRLELGPAWLDDVLATPGGPRCVAVYIEPVAPSAARRRIERDATRLATDAEQRSRGGFRIGARHRRVEEAVAEREVELVAGFAEVAFTGIVVVSAEGPDELRDATTQYVHASAAAGLELRRLDGRHDLALAVSLPLGLPIETPRLS